jgi:Zinc finger, C3HC4 type (RING finger)
MTLECDICFNEKPFADFTYLECFHFLCDNCFISLREDKCPFCRHLITFLDDKTVSIEFEPEDDFDTETVYSEGELSPTNTRKRHRHRRPKKNLSPRSLDKFKQYKRNNKNQYKSSVAHMTRIR